MLQYKSYRNGEPGHAECRVASSHSFPSQAHSTTIEHTRGRWNLACGTTREPSWMGTTADIPHKLPSTMPKAQETKTSGLHFKQRRCLSKELANIPEKTSRLSGYAILGTFPSLAKEGSRELKRTGSPSVAEGHTNTGIASTATFGEGKTWCLRRRAAGGV